MSDKEIKPVIKADPLYQMLRQEDVDSFNASRDSLDTTELTGGDYRGRARCGFLALHRRIVVDVDQARGVHAGREIPAL